MRVARLLVFLAAGTLGACATTSAPERDGRADEWMEFGAMVYDSTASERLALYARARNEHAASPTSSTAIRLAVLTAALEGSDRGFESALSLLGYAERQSAEGPDTDLAFIRFFRPIIRQLAEQQDRLDAEKQEKQVLQEQLDALKRLEEQLNADDALR